MRLLRCVYGIMIECVENGMLSLTTENFKK
jgi:hypothetical protein